MAENLNVGTRIDGVESPSDNDEIEKYCYNDNINLCTSDGGFYKWNEMMGYSTTPGVQGICPTGWHLPGDEEWKDLEIALGMTQAEADKTGLRGTNQGTQLKKGGTSGFKALLAGLHNGAGAFGNRGVDAVFWSSTESGSLAWHRNLHSGEARVKRYLTATSSGHSVRCVKD